MPSPLEVGLASIAAPLFALFSSTSSSKAKMTPSPSSSLIAMQEADVEKATTSLSPNSALPPSSSSSSLSSLIAARSPAFTLHDWDSTPEFLRTPYILTSYRVLFPFPLATRSLLLLHNETFNIWTHLLGAAYLLYLLLLTQAWTLPQAAGGGVATVWDHSLFFIFHFSAFLCFSCSAAYHWYGCMSVQAHSCLYIGDMSAIGALILGSCTPTRSTRNAPSLTTNRTQRISPQSAASDTDCVTSSPLSFSCSALQMCRGCTTASTAGRCFRCCTSAPSCRWCRCTTCCTSARPATRTLPRPHLPPPSTCRTARPPPLASTRTGCASSSSPAWSHSPSCPPSTS